MDLSEVERIFSCLDYKIYLDDHSLKRTDFYLLTQIDVLRRVAEAIFNRDESSLGFSGSERVVDGLVQAVWWMST